MRLLIAGKMREIELELTNPDRLYIHETKEINKQAIQQIMDQATITNEELEFIESVQRWSRDPYRGAF